MINLILEVIAPPDSESFDDRLIYIQEIFPLLE